MKNNDLDRPGKRLMIYNSLTHAVNGEDLFELYAILKEKGIVKSPAAFQKYIVFTAINSIDNLMDKHLPAVRA